MKLARLQGKVAIVTGMAMGIGAACARRFAEEGAKVVCCDIAQKGEDVVQAIREAGGEALFVKGDVSKADDIKRLVQTTVENFGKIDVICNNAAVNIPGSVMELPEEDWNRTMEVNLRSMFLSGKYGVPEMNDGGSIINMASANSFVAEPRLAAYVASKGGILMLTRAMALDCASRNIRVNCICPGWVDTTFNDAHCELFGGRDEVLKMIADIHPIPRTIKPVEIANVAVFLASDESSALTGSPVIADLGYSIK